jgi:hypothetical protein
VILSIVVAQTKLGFYRDYLILKAIVSGIRCRESYVRNPAPTALAAALGTILRFTRATRGGHTYKIRAMQPTDRVCLVMGDSAQITVDDQANHVVLFQPTMSYILPTNFHLAKFRVTAAMNSTATLTNFTTNAWALAHVQ